MWARVIEFMLACWLAASPFILDYPDDAVFLWANTLAVAGLVMLVSLASFRRALGRLHLLNLAAASWLLGVAFFGAEPPPPPPLQNFAVIGLLLGMFALVPSRADEPPRSWREFRSSSSASGG